MDTEHQTQSRSLKDVMRCGMLTNTAGAVTLLHDLPLPEPVIWIEYDEVGQNFSLIYESGNNQPLGLPLDVQTLDNLAKAQSIELIHIADEKTYSSQTVSFLYKQ